MAAKKETSKKKDTTKKKQTVKKITKMVEEPINQVIEEKDDVKQTEEIPTADVAIDEAIANTIEEVVEAPAKEVEKVEKSVKKIIKKLNHSFGYLWNGQMIDF